MNSIQFFIFTGDKTDKKYIYRDIVAYQNVDFVYKSHFFNRIISDKLFEFCFSQRVNRQLNIPFKKLFFRSIANLKVRAKRNVFIFTPGWHDPELMEWLKNNEPEILRVIYFRDTISCYAQINKRLIPERLNENYDLVYCYNPEDVKIYGFKYSSAYFSRIPIEELPHKRNCKISFVGLAKDRLLLLRKIKKKLDENHISNYFVIGGVAPQEQKDDGIIYINNNIPYQDYLGIVAHSDCILEVLKGDTEGATLRCWEAVYYNKKLLTNWKGIKDFSFYNSRTMRYFEDSEDIEISFLKLDLDIDYKYKGENSPIRLLEQIRENL